MAEPKRLLLAHRDDLAESAHGWRQAVEALALLAHRRLELERHVEIIDQSRLSAAGDEDHFLDARLARFVDRILDQRAIDDRQHLLGDGLGGGQQAGAEAGDRETRPCGRDSVIAGVTVLFRWSTGCGLRAGGQRGAAPPSAAAGRTGRLPRLRIA